MIRTLLIVVASVAALDQGTKAVVLASLTEGRPVPLLPGLNLSLGFNTGASFGIMADIMVGRPLAMVAVTGAITLVIAVLALRTPRQLEATGLALVVGGSVGNILDRLRQGAVTDFIDIYRGEWHWPAFNAADMAITCGAALVFLAALPAVWRPRTNA